MRIPNCPVRDLRPGDVLVCDGSTVTRIQPDLELPKTHMRVSYRTAESPVPVLTSSRFHEDTVFEVERNESEVIP